MKKLRLEELGRMGVEEYRLSDKAPVYLMLDNVRSLHNVGSAFRTADCFRIGRIYLTGITGTPPHREIHKTALGATDSVEWIYHEDPVLAVRAMKEEGVRMIAIEQTNQSIPLEEFAINPAEKYGLVFGNEISGVSEPVLELMDAAIEVPQEGTKHSLNISVCVGIVLWEFHKKLHVSTDGARKK